MSALLTQGKILNVGVRMRDMWFVGVAWDGARLFDPKRNTECSPSGSRQREHGHENELLDSWRGVLSKDI